MSPDPDDWPKLLEKLEAALRHKQPDSTMAREDEAAWGLLERAIRAKSQIFSSARWGLNKDDIEDALQQVLLKLQSLETMRRLQSAGSPEGYIVVILKNAALDILRKRQTEQRLFRSLENDALYSAETEVSISEDQAATLQQELRSLSPEERWLLRMRFWRGMSIQQLADEMGLSYSATAVRFFRILHRMRAHMESSRPAR